MKTKKQARIRKLNKYSSEWTMYQKFSDMLDMLNRPKDAAAVTIEKLATAPLPLLTKIF